MKYIKYSSILLVLFLSVILLNGQINKSYSANIVSTSDDNDFIHFIKTGGDSILVESNGRYGLIDTSNPSSDNPEEYGQNSAGGNGKTVVTYLNKVGVKHLDFIIGTHSHSDHIGGVADICRGKNSDNGSFIDNTTTYIYKKYESNDEDTKYPDWHNKEYFEMAINAMQEKGAIMLETTSHPVSGMKNLTNASFVKDSGLTDYIQFTFGDYNIKIYSLYTVDSANENVNSLITLITKGTKKILLMADMNTTNYTEQKIGKFIGQVDLLKAAHHGHTDSTNYGFIKYVKPKNVVIPNSSVPLAFAFPLIYLKNITTNIYITGKSNSAVVAAIKNDNIEIKTYDDSNNLNVTPDKVTLDDIQGSGWIPTHDDDKILWVYLKTDKTLQKGWAKLNYNEVVNWYYFDSDGFMKTGWHIDLDGLTYYLNPSGIMATGWNKIKNPEEKWFYFVKTGEEVSGLKLGAMVTGWLTLGEKRYYLTKDDNEFSDYKKGEMVIGWQVIDNNAYYFDSSGVYQKQDTLAPNFTVSGNATEWTKENVILKIDATDADSGFPTEAYSFNDGVTWQTSKQKTIEKNGKINIKVRDKGNNIASLIVEVDKIDKEKPIIDDVSYDKGDEITLTIEARDEQSGLHSKAYSFDNGNTWQEDNYKTYTKNTKGIIIKVRDVVGNIATYNSIDVKVNPDEDNKDGSEVEVPSTGLNTGIIIGIVSVLMLIYSFILIFYGLRKNRKIK